MLKNYELVGYPKILTILLNIQKKNRKFSENFGEDCKNDLSSLGLTNLQLE